MASAFQRAIRLLSALENAVLDVFHLPFSMAPAMVNLPALKHQSNVTTKIEDLLKDSILWGVPKKRKTIEKRRTKKFGCPYYFNKMYVPKTNILICEKCGSYREAGFLCPNCYDLIKKETTEMQNAIQNALGISPVEDEVVVLYKGEKIDNTGFYEGKRVVELEKERPKLFSDNLLQKSTQVESKTTDVSDIKTNV